MRHTKISDNSREVSYLVEVPPETRTGIFYDIGKRGNDEHRYSLLEIPLPWMYYHVFIWKNERPQNVWDVRQNRAVRQMRPSQVYIGHLFCRTAPVKSLRQENTYNVVPLPNTGLHGYTCCPPVDLPPEWNTSDRKRIEFAIAAFWEQRFRYYEELSAAHDQLHDAAGGYSTYPGSLSLSAYGYWESFTKENLDTLVSQPWLNVPTAVARITTAREPYLLVTSLADSADQSSFADDYHEDDDYD